MHWASVTRLFPFLRMLILTLAAFMCVPHVMQGVSTSKIYFPDSPSRSVMESTLDATVLLEDPGQVRRAIKSNSTSSGSDVSSSNPAASENDSSNLKKEPSRCVWAIISCCSPNNTKVRYACFEILGCQGAFWDNPCTKDMTWAAANSAKKFYTEDKKPKL